MFANVVVKRSQEVVAQIVGTPAVGKKYKFQDIPNLSRNNIVVYGFEAYSAAQQTTTPDGFTVVSAAASLGITITLRDNKKQEFVYQLPMYSAIRANNGGLAIIIKPRIINLTDCYVQITNTSGISASEAVAVNLYYDIVEDGQ
jgi:hypothetical protein